MRKSKKHIVLNEYKSLFVKKARESFGDGEDEYGNKVVSQKIFENIKNFVLNIEGDVKKKNIVIKTDSNSNFDNVSILQVAQKKINEVTRQVLTANSFVGVIVMNDGTTIEILPKINNENEDETRSTFLKMLRALRQEPDNRIFKQANLSSAKIPLMEIFVAMFCSEIENLVRKGLRSDYVSKSSNENFLKGKLNIKKQLLYNFVHKERFFVNFDEYLSNVAENRLLKTTIKYLFSKTKDGKNKKRLRELLFVFDGIDISKDVTRDFSLIKENRMMRDYRLPLQWARVFLAKESFTSFYGSNIAFALLFDMNKVFEDYVAHCFFSVYKKVETQKTGKSLIEKPKKFNLRPDLFLTPEGDGISIIADTKWKLVDSSESSKNWNISQSDIYQMFAYGKKFDIKKIQLIYPKHEGFGASDEIEKMFFEYDEKNEEQNFSLDIKCFDCNKGTIV